MVFEKKPNMLKKAKLATLHTKDTSVSANSAMSCEGWHGSCCVRELIIALGICSHHWVLSGNCKALLLNQFRHKDRFLVSERLCLSAVQPHRQHCCIVHAQVSGKINGLFASQRGAKSLERRTQEHHSHAFTPHYISGLNDYQFWECCFTQICCAKG